MNKIFFSIIMFLILSGCVANEAVEIKPVDLKSDIIIPAKIKPVKIEYYETINLYLDQKLICFDKENSDIFNRNYFKLLNYIEQLEKENKYFREEIQNQ